MRRTAAVVAVLAVLAGVLATVLQAPSIRTEVLTVTVPTTPDDDTPIALDAVLHLPGSTPAPALLLAHGFGSDRTALEADARSYAADGYVVLTWSARGFGASEGTIGLDDPDREVADVSLLVDLLAARPEVTSDGEDPVVGIAGGSYGGGLALLAAAQEPRLDAVVAAAAWHRLSTALSPNALSATALSPTALGVAPGVWKEQWASTLFASGSLAGGLDGDGAAAVLGGGAPPTAVGDAATAACGRFDPDLCAAYARTAVSGVLSAADADLLDRSALDGRLDDISAPTMLIAGQDDTLFGLDQAQANAAGITAPLAVRWVAGDHGAASRIDGDDARRWLDVHLRGATEDLPAFSWVDPVADAAQPGATLPDALEQQGADLVLALDPAGRLTDRDDSSTSTPGTTDATTVQVVRPPGGLPAALSTLPGLGDLAGLGGLLPALDLPGQSASFTTAPFDADVTLLGAGELTLGIDSPLGDPVLFVKLYDVSPGGQTRLLQSAVNATRLAGPATTDADAATTIPLTPLAHRIGAGNRLRLTVTTTDQAFADGVDPALLVLDTADARLVLPTAEGAFVSPLPAAVRIALPVLLVLVLSLLALGLTRRHEQRMARGAAVSGADEETSPVQPDAPIVIRGLVKRYADGKVAVDGLDLTVGRGQVFGLLGPNGAGKTTTMRMLLGLIHPSDGSIRLLGQPLRPGHPVLDRVGVLVEGPGFAPYLTGRQNLRGHWEAGGRPWAEADVDRALAVADLGPAIDRPTRTYSHGMRQRLAIAQALLGQPELLVLDEPTDGLDPEQIRAMRQLLARLGAEGLTILVSSHLLAEVEQMCTHVAVVRRGQVVASGTVAELVGATRTMVIQTDDRDRAAAILTPLLAAGAVDVEGTGLAVRLDDTEAAVLIAALVGAGIGVTAATPRGRLEDAFLELTGGGA